MFFIINQKRNANISEVTAISDEAIFTYLFRRCRKLHSYEDNSTW